jgi:hypothetical protein
MRDTGWHPELGGVERGAPRLQELAQLRRVSHAVQYPAAGAMCLVLADPG